MDKINAEELEQWKEYAQCTESETYTANGKKYLLAKKGDGWTAVFEIEGGLYEPLLEAGSKAHAVMFCKEISSMTFPVEIV